MSTPATGTVFDIRRFSVHDGPGLRTTVFFKGCPLRCLWCHNPESQHRGHERIFWEERCLHCQSCVAACPQQAIRWDGQRVVTDVLKCRLSGACVEVCYAEARQIAGRTMGVAEVMAEIERDVAFYESSGGRSERGDYGAGTLPAPAPRGGATFSGGEPLLQPGFLKSLLEACRAAGIHTALDTCGFARWETLDRIREFVDVFLYDIKVMDPLKHRKFTLVFNTQILENLRRLAALGHNIILRVPIIPGINDDMENLCATGKFAASLPGVSRVDLLPYHPAALGKYERLHRTYRLPGLVTPSEEHMSEVAHVFESFGLQVKAGG